MFGFKHDRVLKSKATVTFTKDVGKMFTSSIIKNALWVVLNWLTYLITDFAFPVGLNVVLVSGFLQHFWEYAS